MAEDFISVEDFKVLATFVSAAPIRQVDLVFAFDGSTAVGAQYYQQQLDFARTLVYGINTNSYSQVGALYYSDQPHIQFYLNTFSKQSDIMAALSMPYP